MRKLKRTLLPLLLVLAMLLLSVPSFAAYSPTGKRFKSVSFATNQYAYTYNGRARGPRVDKVVVKDQNGDVVPSKYYTVTYNKRKKNININANTKKNPKYTVEVTAVPPFVNNNKQAKREYTIEKAVPLASFYYVVKKDGMDKTKQISQLVFEKKVSYAKVKKLKAGASIKVGRIAPYRRASGDPNHPGDAYKGLFDYNPRNAAGNLELSVTFTVKKADKKYLIVDKNGNVSVKKGIKKGKHIITANLKGKTRADTNNYKTRTIYFTVNVA